MHWQIDDDTKKRLRRKRLHESVLRRDFISAIHDAEDYLDEHPDDRQVLHMLASCLIEARDLLTAREAYRQLVEMEPKRAAYWVGFAHTCFECADLDNALMGAEQALTLDRDAAEAHYVRGLILERTEEVDAAQSSLLQAHTLNPMGYPLPMHLSHDDIQLLVADAFSSLAPDVQAFWQPKKMELRPFPDVGDLQGPMPPLSPRVPLLALAPEDSPLDAPPSRLQIFHGNLSHHPDLDAARTALIQALQHEASHWLAPPEA